MDNMCGADLADMQFISKYNKCIIDAFSKYVWFVPLKDKIMVTNTSENVRLT